MLSGKLPDKLLFDKSRPPDREERLKMEAGIVPVKKLFVSDNTSSATRFPSSSGISPAKQICVNECIHAFF